MMVSVKGSGRVRECCGSPSHGAHLRVAPCAGGSERLPRAVRRPARLIARFNAGDGETWNPVDNRCNFVGCLGDFVPERLRLGVHFRGSRKNATHASKISLRCLERPCRREAGRGWPCPRGWRILARHGRLVQELNRSRGDAMHANVAGLQPLRRLETAIRRRAPQRWRRAS